MGAEANPLGANKLLCTGPCKRSEPGPWARLATPACTDLLSRPCPKGAGGPYSCGPTCRMCPRPRPRPTSDVQLSAGEVDGDQAGQSDEVGGGHMGRGRRAHSRKLDVVVPV